MSVVNEVRSASTVIVPRLCLASWLSRWSLADDDDLSSNYTHKQFQKQSHVLEATHDEFRKVWGRFGSKSM
jgi:hypothetical protein